MPATLIPTSSSSRMYKDAERRFWREWKGPNAKPRVVNVFYVNHTGQKVWRNYDRYSKEVGNEEYMWHGTKRVCNIADDNSHVNPCNFSDCAFCSILRATLDPSRADSGSMFGYGAYVAPNPNKSLNKKYLKNARNQSENLVMMRCSVALGKTKRYKHAKHGITEPPDGYDSVTGLTKAEGGDLDYSESAVYTKDAILPVEVIVLRFGHAGADGYPTTGTPRPDPYSRFTRQLTNVRDADWNKYAEGIRNTFMGEKLWTDGVVLDGAFPASPRIRAYKVVRRNPPSDPRGRVVAEGYISADPFYTRLG